MHTASSGVTLPGPMSRTSPRDPDMVAGIIGLLREEQPGAEITVESGLNPDYQPDCLRVVPKTEAMSSTWCEPAPETSCAVSAAP